MLAGGSLRRYSFRVRLSRNTSIFPLVFAGALTGILILLAILQYQWIGRVSDAERDRLRTGLNTAVERFRAEFNIELARICAASQIDPAVARDKDWSLYARQLEERMRLLPSASLIRNIYIWEPGPLDHAKLLRLNREGLSFEEISWPDRLQTVRTLPRRSPAAMRRGLQDPRMAAWGLMPDIPALIHRFTSAPARPLSSAPDPAGAGYFIISLDAESMKSEFFPDLAQRYFAGPEGFVYSVAVVNRAHPDSPIYTSNPEFSPADFVTADARIALLFDAREFASRMLPGGPLRGDRPGMDMLLPSRPQRQGNPFARQARGPGLSMVFSVDENENWDLIARHPQGTLDSVVASARRRNLTMGFGILLLLGLSMMMLVLSTQRARRLARLQMDFVAGISHELRTPLAVICSAGDNLADGIISGSNDRVHQYGEVIRNEGRRLSQMVAQILQFASRQASRHKPAAQAVEVGEIIDSVLSEMKSTIESAGFVLEASIDEGLPRIQADPAALSRILHNLIANAMRYSGNSRWLGIRARKGESRRGPEVQIVVEDRGLGIEKEDLAHVFEPFYRGKAAASTQAPGTGLGLNIARELAAAMGGLITVNTVAGTGSSFTVHMPIPPAEKRQNRLPDGQNAKENPRS